MASSWDSRVPGSEGPGDLVRLTVLLTPEEVEELQRQASADSISVTDVIRRSLAIGRVAWDAQRRKGKLMVKDRNGELRPVVLPSVRL